MDTAPTPDADSPAGKGKALVDDTAAAIRARILSGEIPIGAQLRQAELAGALGVSRTPVREALRQLQAGGLIEVLPNRGAVVRVPSPWEVREAYEVRAELEGLACVRAVRAITPDVLRELREANETVRAVSGGSTPGESASPSTAANDCFHTLIHTVAGNQRLARAIKDVNEAFPRNVSALVLHDNPRHREDNIREHERIVEALAAEDAERARREMKAHVTSAGDQLARWYEQRSATVFRG
ncbi:GntR family transcriptional regulator [Streptomyces scopuliridis]|uniref:GntR family transcriptional regulator n=1 Tax=Streptomyces scopuliridis TaxID=452529 RepID=A0ACD4ZBY1_9ACTN|nr:GntR family transcriptional regulator [Streptomyces scopuliridis]WSB31478.1 GntR family transcriptional regulator [Streptomyces scopuliridis]WSB95725.1 GntR family transcriptional regulator [Streptomyces scopuliridis]WSC10568.1 GntR family transcriptional regulator [Streptomyces scopuliridis]